MKREFQDRMIDQLLREILAGDRPRDMTARVMAQARIIDRFRRNMWLGAGSAIAAAVALAAGLVMYWPHEYPAPSADAQVAVIDGGQLERGRTIATDGVEGELDLGGYVMVKMAPDTQLNVAGSKYQEKVLLSQGSLDVDVTKHKGQFDVAVGPAVVHVTGTKFRVRVGQEDTATTLFRKLYLAVKEGSVEVQNLPGAPGAQTVSAGQEKDFVLASWPKLTGGGAVGFAQRAAQVGARGGPVSTILPRPNLLGLGAATRMAAPSPTSRGANTVLPPLTPNGTGLENRPVQLVTTPSAANRIGRVQKSGPIFYLQNGEGNFFMFERSGVAAAHPEWANVPGDQYTRVVWAEGLVSRLEKYVPATNTVSATQPK